jgi:hypothetical protein
MTTEDSATSGDTLDVIDRDECLRLLAAQPIGRLGYWNRTHRRPASVRSCARGRLARGRTTC